MTASLFSCCGTNSAASASLAARPISLRRLKIWPANWSSSIRKQSETLTSGAGSGIPFVRACCLLKECFSMPTSNLTAPPNSRRDQVVDHLHGVEIADPYRWLEDGTSDETRAWTAAQNAR